MCLNNIVIAHDGAWNVCMCACARVRVCCILVSTPSFTNIKLGNLQRIFTIYVCVLMMHNDTKRKVSDIDVNEIMYLNREITMDSAAMCPIC